MDYIEEQQPKLRFGQWVEIGGRTMLRPGFSLVGLTGVVVMAGPEVPPGCVTVAVDWVRHGFTEEHGYPFGALPLRVNIPTIHLTMIPPGPPPLPGEEELGAVEASGDEPSPPPIPEPDRPSLRLL